MNKSSRLFGILFLLALIWLIVGCGGGSTSTGDSGEDGLVRNPQAARNESTANLKIRKEIRRIVDAKLPSFGLSREEIDCVDENIATMTSQGMKAGATEPSGGETAESGEETVEDFLGPLAQGCL
jgi:hypothetical protein